MCIYLYLIFCIYKYFSEKGAVGFIGFSKGSEEQKMYEPLLKTHHSNSLLYYIIVTVILQRNLLISLFGELIGMEQIPAVARSKEWFCGRSLTGTMGSNQAQSMALFLSLSLSLVSVACCRVQVSTSGLSLVQWSPTEFGVPNLAWS